MVQFLKYVLATLVGLFLFVIVSFFLMVGIGSMMASGDAVTTVKEKSVLKLNFDAQFTELAVPDDPIAEAFGSSIPNVGLDQLKSVLANAALDPNISGISIRINDPIIGMGELEEVKNVLKSFKTSGKFIYTYSDFLSEKGVLIAALADSSFIHPLGSIEFNGLASELVFFKGALDKLGLEPVVFRVGEFKSAVEPFLRTDMSAENREQVSEYLSSLSHTIYSDFAKTKNRSMEEVDAVLQKTAVFSASEGVQNGLVSGIAYADQYEASIRERVGLGEKKKIPYVGIASYRKAKKHVPVGPSEKRIAVIVSDGEIVHGKGESRAGVIGSDNFVKELRRARDDKKVKAIVLRINSPGGSALASDVMWREIQLARKEKPVIASMGDVAASGGYYMAMGCDTIVAHPTTITGSIGIFGLLINTQKLMNDKLGITFDRVKTHPFADAPSSTRKMSEAEKQSIQNQVNEGYEVFAAKAADGRKMSLEKLKAVAGGRVWTGEQALKNGLVDVMGGLNDAIAIAAKKANLEENQYQVRYYPYPKSELDRIIERLGNQPSEAQLKAYFGAFGSIIDQIVQVQRMDKIQARLPYSIEFN